MKKIHFKRKNPNGKNGKKKFPANNKSSARQMGSEELKKFLSITKYAELAKKPASKYRHIFQCGQETLPDNLFLSFEQMFGLRGEFNLMLSRIGHQYTISLLLQKNEIVAALFWISKLPANSHPKVLNEEHYSLSLVMVKPGQILPFITIKIIEMARSLRYPGFKALFNANA